VKIWTAHEKLHAAPVLVREGFSFGALFFGPVWLAAHRAWLPAGAAFVMGVLILVVSRPPASIVLTLGLAFLLGLSGRDLVRWSIARHGFLESAVVAGRDADDARTKLFTARPDLVERSMVAETAP
jgi:Protein of unknown function (DUF2628)